LLMITILLVSSVMGIEHLVQATSSTENVSPNQGTVFYYDNNGNLLNDNTNNYTYDINNRLTTVENKKTHNTTTYTYDPFGNRITTTNEGDTTHYIYDGTDIIQKRDNEGTSISRAFIPDLAMIDYTDLGDKPEETAEILYYIQDILGSTIALTDEQGTVVEHYAYEPYGNTTILNSQNNPLATSTYGNTIMWTGQRYESNHDLYLFPARTYSPELGRFLQQDPLGYVDGMNLYEYVQSNPVNNVDPLGLEGEKWDIIYSHDEELLLNGEEEKLEAVKKARFFSLYFTYTDTPLDITETVSGRDLLTGEKLPGWLVGVTAFAIILPFASGKMMRTGAKAGVRYLTDAEIGKWLHIRPNTVNRMRHAKVLPHRVTDNDLLEFMIRHDIDLIDEPMISVLEAAKRLDIAHATVMRWFNDGVLKGFSFPGSKKQMIYQILKSDVEKFANDYADALRAFRSGKTYNALEAAKILGVSDTVCRRWLRKGEFTSKYGPFYKLPGENTWWIIPDTTLYNFAKHYHFPRHGIRTGKGNRLNQLRFADDFPTTDPTFILKGT